ncbi:MAG: PhnD/SsuA/transferrin family substrate-binding protein [Spirochaetales bacterium]|nr:PhnD/SsuA/transferrin family substrate-binding protein [Spirochaetales bacterium]
MKKKLIFMSVVVLSLLNLFSIYAGGNSEAQKEPLVFIWYPNESVPEKAEGRKEIVRIFSEILDRPIEEQLTTDYSIAIEALVADNACFSWLGGEGYTQAHESNPAILPLVVDSGSSGTLADAKYYSMLAVLTPNAGLYKANGKYSIDNLEQKKFSFVSNSSTSGFRVPSSVISQYFASKPKWSTISSEDLLEGGSKMLFAEVMFGGSHQGSMLNMLLGKSDVSAFCNMCVQDYVQWVEGSYDDPRAGDKVVIKNNAPEPFNAHSGTTFTLISTTPVLNAPIVMNTNLLSAEEISKLKSVLTSDEVAKNEKIFVPKESNFIGIGFKAGVRFVTVEDKWYDPIRELSGLK